MTLWLHAVMGDGALGGDVVGLKEGSFVADTLVPPVGNVTPLVARRP